jgi:signal transduction histidine kinase
VTLAAERDNGSLMVQVRDTGSGIAPSDLPRIFERFYKVDQSRASGGSGLGLALVKHAVEAHGGSVHVESEQAKGSVFSFRIPLNS